MESHPFARIYSSPSSVKRGFGLVPNRFPRYFDVPCFFGRDISRFHHFAKLWYGDSNKLETNYQFGKVILSALSPNSVPIQSDVS